MSTRLLWKSLSECGQAQRRIRLRPVTSVCHENMLQFAVTQKKTGWSVDHLDDKGSKSEGIVVCSATQKHTHTHTHTHTHNESILGYLASVSWKVVRRLQGEACRTDVPCWHVSYSEREGEREGKKERVRVSASELSFILSSQPRGEKSMYVTPPWQLPPSSYLCFSWRC